MKKNLLKDVLAIWGGVCAIGTIVQMKKEQEELHKDTKLMGRIWKDKDDYIYNYKGEKIGRVHLENPKEF